MSTSDQHLNNPILSQRDLRCFEFVLDRPALRPGGAMVLISSSGTTATYSR
jgi:hypothetical protein